MTSAPSPDVEPGVEPASGNAPAELSNAELLRRLSDDRLWLLQQIDQGRWPSLRLDLAALERELGHLLERAADRLD
ncbi:hypothetical protein EVJ50_03115 [Synechococcus sp. RSCCF101]|uniref:hypothetical protein n=1 Tax=Synechococcus sp. RSCCF101 TaxID=2511069 RepID=UPI001245C911|nr:hypothetical protein [Synechococcus sp. RSCCF101]QEY31393.1 hypothetical protein EVJ50_03115 [Synechococcus sp. RSCCF101]